MTSHRLITRLSLLTLLAVLNGSAAFAQSPATSKGSDSLFGLSQVIDVHLQVELAEWGKMQPPKGVKTDVVSLFMAFEDMLDDAVEGGDFHSEKSTRPGLAGYLGIDHQYGKANVTIDGETVLGVGLRYKGNGTFVEGRNADKLSYKIDFNEYDEALEFRGLTKINLNNNISDPSMLREAVSYELFREAGVRCSRIGFARVTMTVPGKFEEKLLGLYTTVEQVDKRFLKRTFGSSDGLLLKPSTFGVFRHLGDQWTPVYAKAYVPKTDPTPDQQQRVIDLARLVHTADDETFQQQIADYVDVDQFLRFVAVNVLLCNLDSFLGATQNYYAYLEPTSNKFQFLPWDMDHSFGAFPLSGTPEARRNLSIHRPSGNRNRLIDRMLEIPEYRESYDNYLTQYMETIFGVEKVGKQIDQAAEFLRPLIPANGESALGRFEKIVGERPVAGEANVMKYFVVKRHESIRRQLAGDSDGDILIEDIARLPVRRTIGLFLTAIALIPLNIVGWIWSGVSGFRGSVRWGFLNLVFYPIAPAIYGFFIRRDLGRYSAIWVTFCLACVVAWFATAIVTYT